MPDSLCRLAVHHGSHTIDLAVPATVHLGQLLPAIVDVVHDDADTVAAGGRWRLRDSSGHLLEESLTLPQNRVHDGDLLWLTTDATPPLRHADRDTGQLLADVARTGVTTPYVSVVISVLAAGVGAAALVWSAHSTGEARWPISCGVGAAAVAGALLARRAQRPEPVTLACSLIAVLYAAVSGALAVPAGPAAAHALFAAAAACSVSAVLLRFGCCPALLTAVTTTVSLAGAAAAVGLLWPGLAEAAHAGLATVALVAVGAAPRLAIVLARIGPDLPDTAPTLDEASATLAHTTLTGLVAGASAAATLGAVLVAHAGAAGESSPLGSVVFTAAVSTALLLRARHHVDPQRRATLVLFGMLSLAASFTIAVTATPDHAAWFAVLAVVVSAGAQIPLLGVTPGPTVQRSADIADYVVLAAVTPLACWAAGVYRAVRESALM